MFRGSKSDPSICQLGDKSDTPQTNNWKEWGLSVVRSLGKLFLRSVRATQFVFEDFVRGSLARRDFRASR